MTVDVPLLPNAPHLFAARVRNSEMSSLSSIAPRCPAQGAGRADAGASQTRQQTSRA